MVLVPGVDNSIVDIKDRMYVVDYKYNTAKLECFVDLNGDGDIVIEQNYANCTLFEDKTYKRFVGELTIDPAFRS